MTQPRVLAVLALIWLFALIPVDALDITEINLGETLTDRSTSSIEYYKFTLLERKDFVSVTMISTEDSDYDLYVKWDGSLPTLDDYDGAPQAAGGVMEACGQFDLSPGTYYFMIHNYSITGLVTRGTYNITVEGRRWSDYLFEDEKRDTKLRINMTSGRFQFSFGSYGCNGIADVIIRRNVVIVRYRGTSLSSEIKLSAVLRLDRDFARVCLVNFATGQRHMLVDRPAHP